MSAARACLLATALLLGAPALGQPGADQPRPSSIRVLAPADHDLFVRAFAAAQRGDWTGARNLAARSSNSVARQLLEWRYVLDQASGAGFDEINAVMKDSQGWPLRGTLQARAEAAMSPAMPPSQVIAWFGTRAPNSSIGNIRLGEALVATGDTARGAGLIRDGWSNGSFDPFTELAIVQRDGSYLTPESDRRRLDVLLWREEVTAARRMMARVDDKTAAATAARIALDGGLLRARKALDKVRNSDNADLLFDWSRALRVAHKDADAHAMLLRLGAAEMVRDHAPRWWTEVSIQARDALAAGDARLALRLTEHAGFSGGDQFIDQQFLAGFICLRFLNEPQKAMVFFQRLQSGVSRPISKARASYWLGRAYEQTGDMASAVTQFKLAATYPETFYGQVALARVNAEPVLHLSETPLDTPPPAELDSDVLMPQIKILADLGQDESLRLFAERDVLANPSPGHGRRLMLSLIAWGYPQIAVRMAKTASYTGTWIPDTLFPTIPLPSYRGPGSGPEPALVLGLIRQETEFDPYAVNPSGARGLIQLMPATAKAAAKIAGLPWRPNDLLRDPDYNIRLSMVEIMGHISRYSGSLVLAIASYNAGPSNARKWIDANGDPRTETDPVDWIELIPFGETRNYVQRVLENTGVYRVRLAGRDLPVRVMADLYAPGKAQPAVLKASVN